MRKIPKLNLADVTTLWEDLEGQFIIGESNFEIPPSWKSTPIGLLDQMPGVYLCGTAAEVGRCFY